VRDPELKARVLREGLETYLVDNCDAWTLGPDAQWTHCQPGDAPRFSAQQHLLESLQQHETGKERHGPHPVAPL
jgi:polyphosphate kinase